MYILVALVLACLAQLHVAQASTPLPSTWPQEYPGMPNGSYSTAWQHYFKVTGPLPNVTWTLPNSYAGSVSVDRPDHPNNTLFFWGFEHSPGSLTASHGSEPWLIWLNGGPGASSLMGLTLENGPVEISPGYAAFSNPYSFDKLLDTIWIDQPVGTGWSTTDSTGYAYDEDQVAQDFLNFLSNFVKVFPSLATRPLIISGESYGGTYVPYIAKALFSTRNPPVRLSKISIGNGLISTSAASTEVPMMKVLETWPQLIDFDPEVYAYFKEQVHICGYDINLTYPQHGMIPTPIDPYSTSSIYGIEEPWAASRMMMQAGFGTGVSSIRGALERRYASLHGEDALAMAKRDAVVRRKRAEPPQARRAIERREVERREAHTTWKRSLIGRPNGTLDPWYGCFLTEEMIDYATNFTFPWTLGGYDWYDVPSALSPASPQDPSVFINDNQTRQALHAPSSTWIPEINYPFMSTADPASLNISANGHGDPSPAPMTFLNELAANASARDVHLVFYSGNDDSLLSHFGTQVVIQNMTFGGIQGFSRQPSTPWFDDNGALAGIIHQERGVTYALVFNAGHNVPLFNPLSAYVLFREFVVGSNPTGTVVGDFGVIGGEFADLAHDVYVGDGVVYYGSGTTTASSIAPSPVLAAWSTFLALATSR